MRLLAEATGTSVAKVEHALRQARHDLRVALLMLQTGANSSDARRKLKATCGNLRQAIGEFGAR